MLWLLPIVTLSFTKRKLTEVISDSYTKYFVCIGNPKELPSKCDQIANATYSTWNEAVANTKSLDEYMIFYIFYKDADVTSTVSFNGKNQFLAFDTIADNNGKFAKIYGNLEITKVDQQVYIFGEENVDGFSGDLNLRLHCSGMNITTISEDIPGVPLFLSSPIKSLHIDYAYAYNYAPVLVTPLLPLNFPKIEYTAQSGNFEKDYVRNNINDTYYIYIPAKQDKNLHFCIYKSEESIKDSPNSDCSHSINTTWMKAVEYIKNEKDVYYIEFVFVDSIDISGKYNFGSSHVFFSHSRKSYNPSIYGSIEFENIDPYILFGYSEFIQELDVIIHLSGANITKDEFTIPSIIGSPRSVEIFYKNDVTKYDIVPAYGTLDGNRPSVIVHSPNNCVNIGKESFDYILQDESDLLRLYFYKVDKNVTEANYCIGSKKKAPAFCKDMTVTMWETFSKLVN